MKIKVMGACANAGRIINAVREVSRGACHRPHPAVRVQAAIHGAPPCYGPLPQGCRGARPEWRRQKGFCSSYPYFAVGLCGVVLHLLV